MLNNTAAIFTAPTPPVTNSYESIATVTVGSGGSATVSFTSIPSTYKHLQIRAVLKNTNAGSYDEPTYMRFNSDTAGNYSYHGISGYGSVNTYSGASSTSILAYGCPSANYTNIWGAGIIDILDYADTNKYKTTRWLNGDDTNGGNGSINLASGNWRSTSAITSITFTPAGGNWAQYSSFALYGIKG